jgi:uncharacterized protein DUF3551
MGRLIAAGVAACALLTGLESARAVDYPWCAIKEGGSRQCIYASRQQCNEDSQRGFGSTCMQNPSFRGPSGSDQAKPSRSKKSTSDR